MNLRVLLDIQVDQIQQVCYSALTQSGVPAQIDLNFRKASLFFQEATVPGFLDLRNTEQLLLVQH